MATSRNRLLQLLIDREIKRTGLISDADINTSALSKLGGLICFSGKYRKVCKYLKCNVDHIVEIS